MAKQYETVMDLRSCRACNKDEDLLRMQHCIRRSTEYTYMPGLYWYAWLTSGIK